MFVFNLKQYITNYAHVVFLENFKKVKLLIEEFLHAILLPVALILIIVSNNTYIMKTY